MKKIYPSDLQTRRITRLLLTIVTGLLVSSAAFGQPTATINATPALTEANLNTSSLTLTLGGGETFIDATLPLTSFTLVGAPTGTTIALVTHTSSTTATIDLDFDYTDFDSDVPFLSIDISYVELTVTPSGVLGSSTLSVEALQETAGINDVGLNEATLDGQTLTVTLTDETFNTFSVGTGSFSPQNAPPGLSVNAISSVTSTSVILTLGFTGTDFDTDYDDFHILINAIVLVQSDDDLPTNSVTIAHVLEPVITDVSIPNDTMGLLDVVRVTITVEDDGGSDFSLAPGGAIGGYALVGLERVDATTYNSSFTVDPPGNSYAASQSIPVTGVQLLNGTIEGNVYSGFIVQDSDLLDASAPVIQYIYSNTGGAQNIGDEIFLRIRANEGELTFTPTSHVNNVLVSSPNIEITESTNNIYNVRYLIAEGDDNVDPGEITVAMTAIDLAGNTSSPPFTDIDPNTLSIDASRPEITSAFISSTDEDVIVGEIVEVVVNADQPNYRNVDSDSWINGVYVDPPGADPPHLTFTDLGDNNYLYTYTVHENDGAVNRGELTINIVLQDAAPFSNSNFPWTDLNENNVQITTNRPSASISGTTEICYGDSAMLTVILGGTAPWIIDIFDGTTITQHVASESPYTFAVYPEVNTTYTIDRVEDGTGNYNDEGAGEATITVHALPDVQITNLQALYDISSPPVTLEYTPEGGTFTGPGISGPPWIFDPDAAGESPEGFPHEIEYTVIDANSCINSDIEEVIVVSGSSFITFEKSAACFNDSTFLITGSNVAGTIGTFSAQPTPPPGAFEDQGDNTAILRPDVYVLTENLVLTIQYTFQDQGGSPITKYEPLTIEYLDPADINEPPDLEPCQNDNLIPLSGNYVTGYTFDSPEGAVFDSLGLYYFNPQLADTGANLIVYEYTSALQCQVSDSLELSIDDAPAAAFIVAEPCIPLDGGLVEFESRSDAGTSVSWLWNFGDPESGFNNNRSTDENPSHHYDDTGSYTVSLSVFNENCDDLAVRTIDINHSPVADFTWNSNCQTDDSIVMTGKETVFSPDTIVSWSWRIDSAGTELFSSDTSGGQTSYKFATLGNYNIRYKVLTSALCPDSMDRTISLSPTIYLSPDNPYSEDFELEGHGWESGIVHPLPQNSWTDAVVNSNEFPVDAASGTRAWYTDRPAMATKENSYVLSPCFNFDTLHRPMVSLEIKRSLEREKDGAALQYTTDNGINWRNVGDVDDGGLVWYNATNMIPFIGNTKTGWTGELQPSEDGEWYEAAHDLDKLAGKPEVRFRVAYGAWDHARTETNDGFAFDNFTIRQRTRLSVLEYFSNANTAKCAETDSVIMEIMNIVPSDVIDIQYHARGDQADAFFNDNEVPANSRGTIYGVTGIPYAVLDGNFMTYNFSNPVYYPNVEDIRKRSLKDPDFKLTIIVDEYTPTLDFSVEVEALRDLPRKERTLYAIILERRVDDPVYHGTNGLTVFRHVARKMLPGAAGVYLGNKSWSKGETDYPDPGSYEPTFFSTAEDNITIAVFIQDDETGEILQAATNPYYTTSIFEELDLPSQVLIYPNPARELVNVYFEESPREEMQFTLYDLSGKMVITDVIGPWQQQFTRTLGDLEQGIYIVEIRTRDRKRVIHRDKLLHY